MPGAAGQLREVSQLADARATLDYEIPVAELRGMPHEVFAGDARAHVSMRFGREHGWATVRLRLHARLQLTCRRCMGPLPLQVDERSRLILVESEAEAERVPVEAETFLAPGGRFDLNAVAREELLLALALVPLRARASQCAPLAAVAEGEVPASRPFAELGAWMKRSAKSRRR